MSKNILVIHSYSINFGWTEEMQRGIEAALNAGSTPVILSVEFLDSKFYYNDSYAAKIANLLGEKYKKYTFDGILTTDNNAMNFILQYGSRLFPGVPVVACGINGDAPDLSGSSIIRLFEERANHTATFRQALDIFPKTRAIHVIVDSTITGDLISQEIPRDFQMDGKEVTIHFLRNYKFQELLNYIKQIPENELLYLIPYFKDVSGEYFSQGRAEEQISQAAAVPVFISWDYQKGTGVLGGNLLNSFEIGRQSTEELLNYLSGKVGKNVEIKTINNSIETFDYAVMQRFSISLQDIPGKPLLINKNPSFLKKYKIVLVPSLLIISVLLLMIYLLATNLHSQKEIHKKNSELLHITNEFMDTQREIIIKLGEVIEKRSKETGEHINRVAELSGFLAEKFGMNPQKVEILKAASPLHDIGKIGIPDDILNSTKKLTKSEHIIMQEHTTIGSEILKGSERPIFLTARRIAHRHHEKWDGTGYPDGLKEDEIPIEARITMIADIYDALSNERSYKKTWSKEKVREYFINERGTFFDPQLTDLLLVNFDEITNRF